MNIEVGTDGFVGYAGRHWRAALGWGGIGIKNREGDGITPVGIWALGRVFWRTDRLNEPQSILKTVPIAPDWGWCDDPAHEDYNRLITLPHPAHYEKMWREDGLYDVVVELIFNTNPIVANKGSAVFLHIAKPDYDPTEGCVALARADLLELLSLYQENSALHIFA